MQLHPDASAYRPLPWSFGGFGALCFFGVGLDLYGFDFGVFCLAAGADLGVLSARDSPLEDAFFVGGVNGRNPSFEVPRLPAGVEGPRASFGDMAGS